MLPRNRLLARVRQLRREGRSIVTTNGSFDLLHAGHVRYLEEARRQGDILVVGLNTDASVRRNKGPNRPIVPQAFRAQMLAALTCVDYVTLFDEKDPRRLLGLIRPDVHVNGAEYGKNCIESGVVRKAGGRLHLIPKFHGLSTSRLLRKIRSLPKI
ncbi:MAG: adenylyltransferase/cytidyltransferase family protein [Nitrospirae bacterium]|nr:adenylyltransferase/cytidyltransferase family protein [Nitrospirota bacterium]